jgi:hypothetical protein
MCANPLGRLITSLIFFVFLIVLIEDWIVINICGDIKRWRIKKKK